MPGRGKEGCQEYGSLLYSDVKADPNPAPRLVSES